MSMRNTLDVGEAAFSVIVITVAAAVASHICFGYGTRKWRETFAGLICGLLLAVQVIEFS